MILENSQRQTPVDLCKLIKHIIMQQDMRFWQHAKMPYVLIDIKNRYEAKRSTSYFISTNPTETAMSVDKLMQLPEKSSSRKFAFRYRLLLILLYIQDEAKKV